MKRENARERALSASAGKHRAYCAFIQERVA
jgi:hypothetical protein